jgi:hypothetical protein
MCRRLTLSKDSKVESLYNNGSIQTLIILFLTISNLRSINALYLHHFSPSSLPYPLLSFNPLRADSTLFIFKVRDYHPLKYE